MKSLLPTALVCLGLSFIGQTAAAAEGQVRVLCKAGVPQVAFAAAEIRQALRSREPKGLKQVGLEVSGQGPAQSYRLSRPGPGTLLVTGADACGAMYGGLDVAEAIRLGTLADLKAAEHVPYVARRGIKFNIPLDARTPSYSDAGDAAQQNIPEMWSIGFWHEFLDEMARHRFNVLSLWNLHPFPSLIKVPEYPDVALEDVMRTTVKLDSTYSLSGTDMVRPSHLANLETVKKMTIAQKTQFWRDVMQCARDRGIEVYLFTWNIFTWGAEGKYGITSAQDNPVTIDYFRKSVRETLLAYPLLAGFGVTAGEHMRNLKGEFSNEKWLWKTYGEGIRDVKRVQPDRSIRLIHRFHQTSFKSIMNEWKDYPDAFDFSYKYSVAHMYSSPAPPFARQTLAELPAGMRTWMTVRNDDIYSFRWGDPEYARAYIKALPGPDKLAGYYMGPDGTIWGREFLSTEPDAPRQLVIKKQWYSFMLWGRLSYDPTLPDALFRSTLAARFPEVAGDKLFAASSSASKIVPQITRFFWGDIDLKWFPEACTSHPRHKGWYTVKHFMEGETMPGSGILNIRAYCDRLLAHQPMDGITPPQVADALKTHARVTLEILSELPERPADKELRLTLGDLRAMAHLGNYYAEKILAATALALFDRTGQADQKDSAVRHLDAAAGHWRQYAAVATSQYKPQLLTRIGYVDLNALADKVQQDVAIARDWKPPRPNIVFILADDLGYGDVGCYNAASKIPTPNLDRLAAEGVRFTDAHAPTSVCTPTRYALLTGRYCWRSRLQRGVLAPWGETLIAADRLTVPSLLKEHGYATACIGKWHLGWQWPTKDGRAPRSGPDRLSNVDFTKPIAEGPTTRGFDYYFGTDVPNYPPYCFIENDRTVGIPSEPNRPEFNRPGPMLPGWQWVEIMPELTRRAVRYVEDSAKGSPRKPFFLYFPLTAPHYPIVPAPEFKGKSRAGDYGDFVVQVDWTVGQVLQAIRRAGIAEDTLVIFTSDNGPEVTGEVNPGAYDRARQYGHYSMGELRGAKGDTWEGGHRVPLVARWPGKIKPGSTSDETVAHVDLMATVAAILGTKLPPSAGEDSCNVLPALLGERRGRAIREATVHHSASGHFAIRRGNWVLIDHRTGDDRREPEWFKQKRGYVPHGQPGELFDLRRDLSERQNLYGEHPEVVRELKGLLENYKHDGRSTPGATQKNDVPVGSGEAKPGSKGKAKRAGAGRAQPGEGSQPRAENNPDA